MWGNKNKIWLHFIEDNIIAADVNAALFLSEFLHHTNLTRGYLHQLEIIDLQRYKYIREKKRLYAALRERVKLPFVFVIGKN